MTVKLIEDAVVLIPNMEHKTFTHSKEVLKKGEELQGEPKMINGLRRGEPFVYRVFRTNDGKIIFLNKTDLKTEKMAEKEQMTEVTLGMDSAPRGTIVNMPPSPQKNLIIWGLAGAAAGFAYAKYKKHDMKHIAKWALIGVAVGAGAGYLYSRHSLNVLAGKKNDFIVKK